MAELPPALKKQIGPFPVAGWLAIIGFGVALGLVLRRTSLFKGSGNADAVPTSIEGDDTGGGAPGTPSVGPVGRVPVSPPSTGTGGSVAPLANAPVTTNAEWSKRAVDLLIAQSVDPVTATAAIAKYLDGGTLNFAEAAALAIALRALGAPPEYVPAPQTEPSTTLPGGRPPSGTPDPSAPPSGVGVRYVVQPNDGDLAQFVTDYSSVEWIPPSGPKRIPTNIANTLDAQGFPVPIPISRGEMDALRKSGPPPDYPANYSGPRTAW